MDLALLILHIWVVNIICRLLVKHGEQYFANLLPKPVRNNVTIISHLMIFFFMSFVKCGKIHKRSANCSIQGYISIHSQCLQPGGRLCGPRFSQSGLTFLILFCKKGSTHLTFAKAFSLVAFRLCLEVIFLQLVAVSSSFSSSVVFTAAWSELALTPLAPLASSSHE